MSEGAVDILSKALENEQNSSIVNLNSSKIKTIKNNILQKIQLNRDDLIRAMSLNGIETRPVFYPLHEMPIYKKYTKGNKFPNSKFISDHGICLPSASTASLEDVNKVSKVFKNIIESIRLFKKTQN